MSTYVATAGWVGVVSFRGGGAPNPGRLRFTSESIVVNQGLEVSNDVHVGQRVAGVFEYRHIIPQGTLAFPMVTTTHVIPPTGQLSVEGVCAHVMRAGIAPYTDPGGNPAQTFSPTKLADEMLVLRGDTTKEIVAPTISSITVSGNSGARIDVSCEVMGIYGRYLQGVIPSGFPEIARAVFFNELNWGGIPGVNYYGSTTETVPRSFNFTSNTNLIQDDSYNPAEPQSLRGFVLGRQDVSCSITVVGAADPVRGGRPSPGNPPQNPVVPEVNVGGIYRIINGLWTAKVINVAGPAELNVSEVTLSGMGTGFFAVTPGPILGGQ
jgi:hypothetical protein